MDIARLEQLGLSVSKEDDSVEVTLDLQSLPLANPVSRQFVNQVKFMVAGERLLPIAPPEVVGLPPLLLSQIERAADLENLVSTAFNEHIFQVQRRSAELQALGLSPQVDSATLELSTELSTDVAEGKLWLLLAADRRGNFRVLRAVRQGEELSVSGGHPFELSEFREKGALVDYLAALFSEPAAAGAPSPEASRAPSLLRYSEVVKAFGAAAMVPPRSNLELLVELHVNGQAYRFAAARVAGKTFRGLLASAQGKLWAERFEVDAFPGIAALAASVLQVPVESVRIVGQDPLAP